MQAFYRFGDDLSWRLSQSLLHFLWQGCLIGLAVLALDQVLKRASSSTRYALYLVALFAMAACLPATYLVLGGSRRQADARIVVAVHPASSTVGARSLDPSTGDLSRHVGDRRGEADPSARVASIGDIPVQPPTEPGALARGRVLGSLPEIGVETAGAREARLAAWLRPFSPFISAAYLIGVVLMMLRLSHAWRSVRRLRRKLHPTDDPQLLATIARLVRPLGLRAAPAVAYCREIAVPVVIGVFKPLVLLPASIVSALPPDQVEAIVAHELAHLKRFDPLVNMVQRLIEVVLFFHPAVWYVSRRVSVEREIATDDLVLSLGFQPVFYADALVHMAEVALALQQDRLPVATLAASGDGSAEFKRRVMRLLGASAPAVRMSPWRTGPVVLVVTAVFGLAMLSLAWPEHGNARADAGDAKPANDAPRPGRKIDDFKLKDHLGAEHELKDFSDRRLLVVAFLGTECPIANRYGPRLAKLADDYRARGVAFIGIDSNQQDAPTEIGRYVREHGINFPLLKDPGNRVADLFGAVRTPEVFVLDAGRRVRYWGAIDDQYGVGYVRNAPTQQFLATAIDELLADRRVSRPESPAPGCRIGRVPRKEPTGDITYAKQVSRILERRCVECHRDGGIAPFALDSYAAVAGWAETIREVVAEQRMPPWHADPRYGHFSNDNRMPDAEQQLLFRWIENGIPEGVAGDLPPPSRFVDGWSLGQPDMIVSMPEPFTVAPDGVIPYRYITIDPGFKEGKWVRASEVRPGVRSVVHHVIAYINPPGGDPILKDRGVGFETVGGYVPGAPPMQMDRGVARYVPAGSTFVLQIHYTPDGKTHQDQTKVGLYFADPATVRRTMQTVVAANLDFEIPPRAGAHQVEADVRLGQDTEVHALLPHMHFRGKSFRFTAIYPNGTREILLDVPRYDFNWQHIYRLARPKVLPEGTLLKCVAYFDNSKDNPSNPDPTSPVKWGEQTWEEMMVGYVDAVFLNQDLTRPEPSVTPLANGNYRVHFSYQPDRTVRSVTLAGTFNEWNTSSHPLKDPDHDGVYTGDVELKPGPCRYKFVVDGEFWTHDPASRILTGFFHESFFVAGAGSRRKTASQP